MSIPDDAATVQAGPAPTSAAELLAEARAHLQRVSPQDAQMQTLTGALLIDIRSDAQRSSDGVIPGARFVARNVLEWRCDPASEWSDADIVSDLDRPVVVFCNEGYQSSLVAAVLQRLGFQEATDMIGGFQAWREAGLPVAAIDAGEDAADGRTTGP